MWRCLSVKDDRAWAQLTDDFVRENIKMCNDLADARERLFEAQQLRTAEVHLPEAHATTSQHARCQQASMTEPRVEFVGPDCSMHFTAGDNAQNNQRTI